MDQAIWACRRIADGGFGGGRERYADCQAMPLRQHWISATAMPREGAQAWAGWNAFGLCLYAEMVDSDIFTKGTADNQPFWELGDTCEFFIKPGAEQPSYWEIHVTPNDLLLDLRVPERDAYLLGSPSFAEASQAVSHARKLGRAYPERQLWTAELWVPWSTLGVDSMPGAQASWSLAVCRYNYTRPQEDPEYSATAALTKLSYHRHEEYHRLRFQA